METSGSIALWQRLEQIEQSLCLRVNRGCRYPSVKALFSVVSRLGDGGFWYLLMLVLAVNGETTALVAASTSRIGRYTSMVSSSRMDIPVTRSTANPY